MNFRTFLQILFFHSLDAKIHVPRLKSRLISEVANAKLVLAIDPRDNNDDAMMKKVIGDNEKIHLLRQLQSDNVSVSRKLELVKNNTRTFPVNVNFDDLFREFILSSDIL